MNVLALASLRAPGMDSILQRGYIGARVDIVKAR